MPLGPLRKTCVQPAPKSRLAVFGLAAYEDQKQIKRRSEADQKQIKGFPAEAGPTGARGAFSGTGFSREEDGLLTTNSDRSHAPRRTLCVPHTTLIQA